MIEAGEDPLFIARRLIILASEDIGNANPMGLVMATNAFQAVHAIGMPEGRIVLAQATTYLACSEKSNRSYLGIEEALVAVKRTGAAEIPYAIRNAPTAAMKEWGYGQGYQYPHDSERGWVSAQYLPESLKDARFYRPSQHGTEKKIADFLKSHGKD
jgi:putative ATPase